MHSHFVIRFAGVLALMILSTRLGAGIVWECTEVEVTPAAGATRIEIPFAFHVEGEGMVQILDTGSSCGCAVAELEKRLYTAGEHGILKAVFTPGVRQGRQSKQLTVKTVEAGRETQTKLTFIVNVPEWAKPDISRLEWKGLEDSVKSLKIKVKPGAKLIARPSVSLASERFHVELRSDASGQSYTLKATPVPDRPTGMTPLFIDVFSGETRVSVLTLFLISR